MFGFSIFMNDSLSEEKKQYIRQMASNGFVGIFTSMHIPEDDVSAYQKRLIELGSEAKKNKLELMVDISGEALERAGFSLEDLTPLKAIGVTGLRMDYHISNQQIADWSHQLKISLNASTITPKDIDELKEAEADFSQIEAWHNYYPRPETGLDKEWYQKKKSMAQNSRSPCPRFCTRRYRVERPTISRIANFGRTSRDPSSCRRSRSISK